MEQRLSGHQHQRHHRPDQRARVPAHPTSKLTLSASANYSDNLSGQLIQSVVAAGGVAPGLNTNEASDSLDLMAVAGYTPEANLQASAYVERRTETFEGESYGVTSLRRKRLLCAHPILDGNVQRRADRDHG